MEIPSLRLQQQMKMQGRLFRYGWKIARSRAFGQLKGRNRKPGRCFIAQGFVSIDRPQNGLPPDTIGGPRSQGKAHGTGKEPLLVAH